MKRLLLLLVAVAAIIAFAGAASRTTASAGTTPGTGPGIFLCYSVYQVDPGVWPKSEAASLVNLGYWQPFAVPGIKEGGTNVGTYHLTCNLLAGLAVPTEHGYVGADGTVLKPDVHDPYAGQLGWYMTVR